uniref:Uncharacterized protein n=1 Tax=Romanomermis culicivorax TaxID=13658 RepID=A0A915ILZ8_ROMCU
MFEKEDQQTMGVIIQSKSTIQKSLIMDGGIVVSTTKMHDSTNVAHTSQTCHSLKDITVDQSSLRKVSSTGQSTGEVLEKYPTIEHTTVKLQKDEELEEHYGMSSTDISSGLVADSIFVYSEPAQSKFTIHKSLIMDGGIVVSTTKMHDSTNVVHTSQTCHSLKDITVDQSSLRKVSSTRQ